MNEYETEMLKIAQEQTQIQLMISESITHIGEMVAFVHGTEADQKKTKSRAILATTVFREIGLRHGLLSK